MKKIKIYKAFPSYQNYLDQFYEKHQGVKNETFNNQYQALANDCFPWIFSWSKHISDENIEVFETVHNCEWLQKSWSQKDYRGMWQLEILFEQVKKIQPQICVLYPPELFTPQVVEYIRNLVHHEVLMVGYDGMNRMNVSLYDKNDLIITCSKYISEYYQKRQIKTFTLEFGFDDSILKKINIKRPPKFNVGYTGNIYFGWNDSRFNILKYLTSKTKVSIRSEFKMYKGSNLISKSHFKLLLKEKSLSNNLALWRIGKMNEGPVYGLEMYQFIRDSKINLNTHGSFIDFSANARMYEITGAGRCMLTDWKRNTCEIFEIDKEIITYNSNEEALDKVKFYSKNESAREKIAQAGQIRTLTCYNYTTRFTSLVTFLKKEYLN